MRQARPRLAAIMLGVAVLGLAGSAAPALADKLKHTIAVFAGLDKITGRIISFEVKIGETVQFGTLQITPRVCYSRPPTEAPRTDGFVEIYEVRPGHKFKKIFSGWMFADSPGLNGVEHPIYDVWLTDCNGGTELVPSPSVAEDTDRQVTPAAAEESARPAAPAATEVEPAATPRRGAATTDAAAAVPALGPPIYVPSAPVPVAARPPSPPRPPSPRRPPSPPRPPGSIPDPGHRQPVQRYYPVDPDDPFNN